MRGDWQHRLPEQAYVARLLTDLSDDIQRFDEKRPLTSVFIGGGTPSLFSGSAISALLDGIHQQLAISSETEITLEANPGTVDEKHFVDYRRAGVNRLSIGIQSFNAKQLKTLGRIHQPQDGIRAVGIAQDSGFDNINIDLMFGLPQQTEEEALDDIKKGIALKTEHLSYYQLTLEPNTPFAHHPPSLPEEDCIAHRFETASTYLQNAGFRRYEISAWSRGRQSKHNRNYWLHGDYLGIGAGAHGKITVSDNNKSSIIRTTKPRSPKHYLAKQTAEQTIAVDSVNKRKHQSLQAMMISESTTIRHERIVAENEMAFEFMLNALRLCDGFPRQLLAERGLIVESDVLPTLQTLADKGLLVISDNWIRPTEQGQRFVNDMVEAFL